jgi:hypothetical protein
MYLIEASLGLIYEACYYEEIDDDSKQEHMIVQLMTL